MKRYPIYRGVDNEIEFKGLRGRYFYYAVGGGVGCIMTALFLHILGVPILLNLFFLVAGLLASYLIPTTYNKSHGRWGFDKLSVQRLQPRYVVRYQSIRSLLKNRVRAHKNNP
ncbi:DUF4133 domain-containing protein [Telluribacter humicola]|uniref:DUF4133 domain-containing protein n=1 Tax=Telluribacter humicola TaxID=1720261 RepID=UPI001A96922D|nr:DUF4133 domain-containing protein [Telluribacter humicola]